MGHEEEDYAAVPPALNMSKEALMKAEAGRVESSIGLAKLAAKKAREEQALKDGETVGDGDVRETPKEEEEEHEHENQLKVKPTKPLRTYEQRRKFIVKAMDLHRHTIGGGRSGRRGRAECTAFLRFVLEILDDQYEEALEAEGNGGSGEEGVDVADIRDDKGRFLRADEEEEEMSSSSEEEESEEEGMEGEEEQEEEQEEESEPEADPKEAPKPQPKATSAASAAASTSAPPKRKGPGRPRKNKDTTTSQTTPSKPLNTSPSTTKPQPKTIMNEQDFFDQHNDLCEVCNQPGELLCCATCNLVFHVQCARPKLHKEPPDDWKCAYCWGAGVMGGKKDGKERRKAGQAVREMERMRREIREERERGGGRVVKVKVVEVAEESAEEEEAMFSDVEDGDKKPAAKMSVDTSAATVASAAGAGSKSPRVAVAEAAKSGCRKCIKELATGEKTRKTHDDFCPRKWKSVGKPPSATPKQEEVEEVLEEEFEEEEDVMEEDEDDMEEDEPLALPSLASTSPKGQRDGGMVSLEEAAEAGCIKCQKELDTGEKTRKVHADDCPRKYRGAYKAPLPTAAEARAGVLTVEVDNGAKKPAAMDENVKIASLKSPPETINAATTSDIPIPRKVGRPPSSSAKKTPGKPGRPAGKPGRPPSTGRRPISPKNPVSLAQAAAAGCIKCQKELATGEKTRKVHADFCPRKWRAAGRPPAGTPSPASAEAAAARAKSPGKSPMAVVAAAARAKSPGKSPTAVVAAAAVAVASGSSETPGKSPGKSRRGKRTRDQIMIDTATPAAALTATAAAATAEIAEEDEDLAAIAAIGDLAQATAKEQDDKWDEHDSEYLKEVFDTNEEDEVDEGKVEEDNEEEAAEPLKGGGVTFKMEMDAVLAEVSTSSVQGPKADEVKSGDNVDDNLASEEEDIAKPLRGGGRTKRSPVKMEEGDVNADPSTPSAAAAAAESSQLSSPMGSGASTPNRELEGLSVPTPLKLGGEHELTYANNGRVQRSRKRPAIFDPLNGPASEWRADGDGTPTGRKVRVEMCGEVAVGNNCPEPLRGGARPKKEESAAITTAAFSPAAATDENDAPKPRGRPPSKQTKRGGATKKQNAKRALIKKETNNSVHGVGILNRKPGSLFDCSACLDIGKMKLCCYCACRLCFNKFGKEQTILCDKCDQEYHTFCLGLDKIPDEEWECPACIQDEKKKRLAAERKQERETKKKLEEEKRKDEETKKAVAIAKRKIAYAERKKQEEDKKRISSEKRKAAYEKRKVKEAELRSQGIAVGKDKTPAPTAVITRKRGPGRPPKAETLARLQAQLVLQQQQQAAEGAAGQPVKRGRGRPRKDGSAPIPRKLPTKSEISATNLYMDTSDMNVERSRSGRKIQRTVFHDELQGGGLMKRSRTDEHGGIVGDSTSASSQRIAQASMYVAERSAGAAARSAIAAGGRTPGSSRKEPRRKPGARECMQMSRKFGTGVLEQKYFDVLMDYSKRGKVDHLIRMRERMDEHSRFLESQLAGLEALVKEKGEWNGKVPAAKPKSDGDAYLK